MSEILAMLTAKTTSFTPTGGGGEITPQMVASACSGLSHYEWLFVTCKLAIDTNGAGYLRILALQRTQQFAENRGWRVSKKEPPNLLAKLSDMALDSALKNNLCFDCRGTKVNSHGRVCSTCGGSGLAPPPSQASRARIAGVSIESWNRRWKKRFAVLVAEYEVMEAHASSHINRQLESANDN